MTLFWGKVLERSKPDEKSKTQTLNPNATERLIPQHDVQQKASLSTNQTYEADSVITIFAWTAATIFGVLVYALAIDFLK
jgi:hypothetical protein